MTYHLYGSILTAEGVAANNRGETAGNTVTIQKILRGDDIYTTVSAEAIRYAMREYWTRKEYPVNREIHPDGSTWNEPDFDGTEQNFIDDDLFGYMDPDEETNKRRGRLEVSRALSVEPWPGDVVFSVASEGAHPDRDDPAPYSTEVHETRYQFLFALTPGQLADASRVDHALEAFQNLSRVAGNHSTYLYDFAPEAVVLRWTHDPAPRMMYCFETERGRAKAPKVQRGLESGDLGADEIVAGGPVGEFSGIEEAGASVHDGVKDAFSDIRQRALRDLGIEEER